MSNPQVGQGDVAILPTFKGFRTAVNKETGAAAKESTKGFRSAWSKEGPETGKTTGRGFRKAFEGESKGFTDRSTQELERAVAKSSRALSQARLKQLDQVGKVRVAERQLAEAQEKYANDSSQVVRALERLQSETRKLEQQNEDTERSTKDLRDAQANLAAAADRAGDELAESGRRGGRRFLSGFREIFAGSFLGTTFANFISNITSQITYAIGSGIRAAAQFTLDTIDIASSLNESVNAVKVSYGAASDAIFALGQDSAKTFAVSRLDLNRYAVQFSAFAKGIAGQGGDVAGTFQSILGRATDFASVMDLEVSEALELFQSGLAGETEPLRRYGKDLSAATVEAYAYANGIAAQGAELTEAQKLQARYGALMQQTAEVQGDYAKTAGELANQNRSNAAVWQDLQAIIGTAFLPIASQMATVLAEEVLPAISDLLEGPGSVKGVKGAFSDALPPLEAFAKDVLPLLPDLFKSIAETLPDMIRFLGILSHWFIDLTEGTNSWFVGLSSLIQLLTGDITLEEYGEKLSGLTGSLGDVTRGIQAFGSGTRLVFAGVQTAVSTAVGVVQARISEAVNFIGSMPQRASDAVAGIGRTLYSSGRALIQGFIDGITSMLKPVGDSIAGVMEWVRGFFPSSPAKRGPFSGSGWTGLKDSGGAVMEQWTSGFARPDLTGALAPALASTGTASTAIAASYGGPSTLVVVDQDGQLIGRMQVEASRTVAANEQTRLVTATSGRRPT